jgi:hypothetical protein
MRRPLPDIGRGGLEAGGEHAEFEMKRTVHCDTGTIKVGFSRITEPSDGFRIEPRACQAGRNAKKTGRKAIHGFSGN